MSVHSRRPHKDWKRRELFQAATAAALADSSSGLASAAPPQSADVYTRLGVRPFINATATLTMYGGSRTMPEVVAAIEHAAHYHVNLDELMEKAGARIAELLKVESAVVTSGASAALTHATAACIAGSDPEKMHRLPNLRGLKNTVIMPRESRNVYDRATRNLGVEIVEVDSVAELQAALGPSTAMIQILGSHFGKCRFGLAEAAPLAKKAGVPILVDAAADYLIIPNPYIALGADLVAYSGGKIIRGPQGAGLLIGRKDLVYAARVNSAPHNTFGRGMKVSKEEVVGMYVAVETFVNKRNLNAEFREWESWYAHISDRITKVPGVTTEIIGPVRGGPFPTLAVSWDISQVALTAGQVGTSLLNGEPRIMSQASGSGQTFLIRPAALRPGEYKLIADRLTEIFRRAPKLIAKTLIAAPTVDLSGRWDVRVEYQSGVAEHQLLLTTESSSVSGTHLGWAFQGELKGIVDGDNVELRSSLAVDGQSLRYEFNGRVSGNTMEGELGLGEYGRARWTARRHLSA